MPFLLLAICLPPNLAAPGKTPQNRIVANILKENAFKSNSWKPVFRKNV
jgi:hypothetical protein